MRPAVTNHKNLQLTIKSCWSRQSLRPHRQCGMIRGRIDVLLCGDLTDHPEAATMRHPRFESVYVQG